MSTKETLKAAIRSSRPTLAEFYADWCPHCQRMMPVVAQLKREVGEKVNIVQIEGDRNPDLMKEYSVNSYPTWIIFVDGHEAWRDGGEKPLSELKEAIDRFF